MGLVTNDYNLVYNTPVHTFWYAKQCWWLHRGACYYFREEWWRVMLLPLHCHLTTCLPLFYCFTVLPTTTITIKTTIIMPLSTKFYNSWSVFPCGCCCRLLYKSKMSIELICSRFPLWLKWNVWIEIVLYPPQPHYLPQRTFLFLNDVDPHEEATTSYLSVIKGAISKSNTEMNLKIWCVSVPMKPHVRVLQMPRALTLAPCHHGNYNRFASYHYWPMYSPCRYYLVAGTNPGVDCMHIHRHECCTHPTSDLRQSLCF